MRTSLQYESALKEEMVVTFWRLCSTSSHETYHYLSQRLNSMSTHFACFVLPDIDPVTVISPPTILLANS